MAKSAGKAATKQTQAPKKAATKTAAKAPKKAAAKKAGGKNSGGGKANPGFMAPLTITPQLTEVVGNGPLPRTEIIKKIWDYIKANNLQDNKNRRMINADEKLKVVFDGKDQVSMFELAKIVNNHVSK
jgi:chromatin remodeling complex protein RSC6